MTTATLTDHGNNAERRTYDAAYVRSLFDRIAPRYDLLNHLLSFNVDRYWRRKAVNLLAPKAPRRVLDVATGTADLAIALARLDAEQIVGIDPSQEMLRIGGRKVANRKLSDRITLHHGAAESLPYSDRSFDAATVAFGVRNFSNLELGVRELFRVLATPGTLVILEFSRPNHFPIKQLYGFYSRRVLPWIGGMISRSREAYDYLPKTVREFPDRQELVRLLQSIGFKPVNALPLTFGIVTIYIATKD